MTTPKKDQVTKTEPKNYTTGTCAMDVKQESEFFSQKERERNCNNWTVNAHHKSDEPKDKKEEVVVENKTVETCTQ